MGEIIDIPQGIFVFWGGRATEKYRILVKLVFYGKNRKFCKNQKPMKLLNSRDFPYFPVYGASGTTNNPLGISTFSAMGAQRLPCNKENVNFKEFHGISVNYMKIHDFHGISCFFAISMILWLHDMLETIDIPKGILMFRGGRTQACGNHIFPEFL